MKQIVSIAAAISLFATPLLAQQADATSTSQSQSGVHNQGDNIRSGSVVAPSSNSTAPCVVSRSFGVGGGGAGIGFGTGTMDKKCVTRIEAQILTEIAAMPAAQRRVAVTHFCRFDPDMRDTMVALGWCQVR